MSDNPLNVETSWEDEKKWMKSWLLLQQLPAGTGENKE
jgi:hypothetical protein